MTARPDVDEVPCRVEQPRSTPRLLVDARFGTLVWGKLLSSTAYWMHTVVASILVYGATGSALVVGVVVAAQLAPQLIFAPISGAWVDRGYATAQIVTGRLLIATGSGVLAIWLVRNGDSDRALVTAALLCSLLCGVGFALGGAALQAVVPSLVRSAELPVAMALNSAPLTVSAVAGPSIGAYVSAELGPAAAFGVAASIHLLFAAAIVVIRLPKQRPDPGHTDFSMRAMVRHLRADRRLLMLLIGIAGIGFGAEPSVTLAPALIAELNERAHLVGVVTGSFGAGAAAGLVLFRQLNRWIATPRLASVGVALMVVGLFASGAVPAMPGVLAGFALGGFGYSLALSTFSAMVQERAPDRLRGRIMALWLMAMLGARPIAAFLDGLFADQTSARIVVLGSIAVLLVVLVITWPSSERSAKR